MATASEILKQIKENDVKFVDLRFTDPKGKLQHLTMDVVCVDEDMFADGVMFDGSSIVGWKAINESDMVLMPDPETVHMDPFFAQSTMVILCDILDPVSGEAYNRDPRGTAKKAEAYLKASGIGDTVFVGPEAEFFVFDDVRYKADPYNTGFKLDSTELPSNDDTEYETGNLGHRPRVKGGYFPVPPIDSCQDMRSEMLTVLSEMGVVVEKHHHEVAAAQHELGIKFDTLVRNADKMQIYKYVVHQVANAYGKTATFMPKPIFGDNGSGMHVHQSIWNDGAPLFYDEAGYGGLSDLARWYIGGILQHAPAICAFTNPGTNSYKRLVPGYEAPVNLAYSSRNRSASVRIPIGGNSPKAKRLEFRCPDPTANPYLAFAVMMMAGLDGIQNKIDPGKPLDKDIYALAPEEAKDIPKTPGALDQALNALERDHAFLLKGDVFTPDVISTWIDYKRENEVDAIRLRPHPYEFVLYYDI
jgi:glutamine synthetase